jgi:glycosyltransferase involved in cell wall biosynthesis
MNSGHCIRATVLTNILSPYRIPLYQRLASMPGLDVTVILLAESEANRQWHNDLQADGFATRVLPGKSLYLWRWELPVHLNRGLGRTLDSQRPDVVMVSGWDQIGYWQAAWWCRRRSTPLVLHNGSTRTSGLHKGRAWMALRRTMVRLATSYVAYGSQASEYLLSLGAQPEQVHVGLNTVDVDAMASAVQVERAKPEFSQPRSAYPPILLLYVGQLIPRKRVDLLLHALASVETDDLGLLIVGAGPEEQSLRNLAAFLSLRNVYFEGFQQPAVLPRYYALADALVLPSDREVWGLVVNEALAAGLFVICSDTVGAGFDVISSGWNGDTFAAGSAEDLGDRLRAFCGSAPEIAERREAIASNARSCLSIGQLAGAFAAAIGQASRKPDKDECTPEQTPKRRSS